MDPLTILAVAKGSYEAIKTGLKYGKEIQGMMKDVSSLYDSIANLTKISSAPKPKVWGKGSAEKQALDAFMAKKEAQKLFEEVKNMVIAEYGLTAWDHIQKEIAYIKKEQHAAQLQREKEFQQMMDEIMFYGSLFAGILILGAALMLGFYLKFS